MMDILDIIDKIIAIVTSIVGIGLTIPSIKKNLSVIRNQNNYYFKFLKPMMSVILSDGGGDLFDKMLHKKLKLKKDYIPRYMFYIYDKYINENLDEYKLQLKQIIITDYIELYGDIDSQHHVESHIINRIIDILITIGYTLCIFLSIYLGLNLVFRKFFLGEQITTFIWCMPIILFIITVVGVFINCKTKKINIYTLDEEKIKKLIKGKLDKFEQNKDKNYIMKKYDINAQKEEWRKWE